MSKPIQISNVPEEFYRRIEARAALEGLSLSEFLLGEMKRLVERPSPKALRVRLGGRTPIVTRVPPVQAVRDERDGR